MSPAEQIIFYYANDMRARGISDQDVEAASATRRQVWHCLSSGADCDDAKTVIDRARTQRWFDALDDQSGDFGRPSDGLLNDPAVHARVWFRREADYDPTIALRALSVPALFIFATRTGWSRWSEASKSSEIR